MSANTNPSFPDTYEMALEHALHARGMDRANYIARIEQENTELRKLIMRGKPHLPQALQQEIKQFIESHDTPV